MRHEDKELRDVIYDGIEWEGGADSCDSINHLQSPLALTCWRAAVKKLGDLLIYRHVRKQVLNSLIDGLKSATNGQPHQRREGDGEASHFDNGLFATNTYIDCIGELWD